MGRLHLALEYEWEPFTVGGEHLTFAQLAERKLLPNECSHWGAAVYKWEGPLSRGELGTGVGRVGIVIGETDNISGRIQQLAAAASQSGELWRHKSFLSQGDFRLFVFELRQAAIGEEEPTADLEGWFLYSPRERRIMYKDLVFANQALKRLPYVVLMH